MPVVRHADKSRRSGAAGRSPGSSAGSGRIRGWGPAQLGLEPGQRPDNRRRRESGESASDSIVQSAGRSRKDGPTYRLMKPRCGIAARLSHQRGWRDRADDGWTVGLQFPSWIESRDWSRRCRAPTQAVTTGWSGQCGQRWRGSGTRPFWSILTASAPHRPDIYSRIGVDLGVDRSVRCG